VGVRRRFRRLGLLLGLQRLRQRIASAGRRDAVFVWIPKTAGKSLDSLLSDHGCVKLKTPELVRHAFPQRGLVNFGHQYYPALVAAGIVTPDFDRRAFKFCFVRNPWDRAVSLFIYLRAKGRLHPALRFHTFAHLLHDRAYDELGLYTRRGLSHCNPQIAWLRDPEGRIFVDFVGRFETLEADVAKLGAELGLTGTLPRLNVSERGHYRDYYDDHSRRLVAAAYAEDVETFGYHF
jgi:hypothetical protein